MTYSVRQTPGMRILWRKCTCSYLFHYSTPIASFSASFQDFTKPSLVAENLPNNTVSIMLPPATFNRTVGSDINIVFSEFNSSVLYPLFNKSAEEFDVASTVVSATVVDNEDVTSMLSENVTIILRLHVIVSVQHCTGH